MRRVFLALLAFLASAAFAATPRLSRVSPLAVVPGAATELRFSGDDLEAVTKVWASFPCEVSKIKSSSSEAVLRFKVDSDVPPQLGAVRLIATNALSNLQFLLVDDLRSVAKHDARKGSPQAISGEIAIDVATDEMQVDYFSFNAKKNEQLSFDLFAHRIGSALDPMLRILDVNGRELLYSLQFAEPNGDPRFLFKAPETGAYRIELRDVGYRGGANYFYHLRFGHFPLITGCLPPVIERTTTPRARLLGPATSVAVKVSKASGQNETPWLPLSSKSGSSFGFAAAQISDSPQVTEIEPNDKPEQATRVAIRSGVGINGLLNKPRDRDYYEFKVEKAVRIAFNGMTRALGAPCDLSIRLLSTNNAQIAESSNGSASDASLTHSFEKPGVYRLLVEELTGASAPDFVYHIDVKQQPAPFTLAIEDEVERSTNGFFSLKIECARDHYDGPIKLSVLGLESAPLEDATVAKKKTNATLRIKLPDAMPAGKIALVRIVGSTTIDGQTLTNIATTVPAFRKSFPTLLYPPLQFDGLIWLGPK